MNTGDEFIYLAQTGKILRMKGLPAKHSTATHEIFRSKQDAIRFVDALAGKRHSAKELEHKVMIPPAHSSDDYAALHVYGFCLDIIEGNHERRLSYYVARRVLRGRPLIALAECAVEHEDDLEHNRFCRLA